MKKGLHKLKDNFCVRAKDASESFGPGDLHFSGKRGFLRQSRDEVLDSEASKTSSRHSGSDL
jgi:hypothetical protein